MTSGLNEAEAARDWPYYTEPEWLEVRGVRTAYRRRGDGESVVYLHGAGLTRRWLPLYDGLAQSMDLLVPEHPGFGDSDLPDWLDSFDDLVLHYDELFDLLELDRVHLVGHSVGGWIAADLAVYYPKRVKSLTLIAPVGLRVPNHPIHDIFRMTPEEAGDILLNGDVEPFVDYLSDGDTVETMIQGYRELTTLGRLMWNPRYDFKLDHRLGRVSAPALVVAPDEDRIVPAEHFQRWLELLPNASLQTISGDRAPTSHLLIIQEPTKLASAIDLFISESTKLS